MFLLLFTITIHELGHLLIASILRFDIKEINIYPFGGISIYESNINENIFKEILICVSGPLIQLLFVILIYFLRNFITETTYFKFILINKYLFMFNLLPIVPLDGGKLLNNILDLFIPYKYSLILSSYMSLILSCLILIHFLIAKDYLVVILFLLTIINILREIKLIKTKYKKFLLERYLFNYNYKYGKIINSENKFLRNKKHKVLKNNYVYTEVDYLKKFVFNV